MWFWAALQLMCLTMPYNTAWSYQKKRAESIKACQCNTAAGDGGNQKPTTPIRSLNQRTVYLIENIVVQICTTCCSTLAHHRMSHSCGAGS